MVKKIKELAKKIALRAIDEVKPENLVSKIILKNNKITIGKNSFAIPKKFYVFGAGKASLSFGEEFNKRFGKRIKGGLILSYESKKIGKIRAVKSDHPIVGKRSIENTEKLLEEFMRLDKDDFFIFILSGGASAMMEKFKKGITLEKARKMNEKWIKEGIDINEINKRRKEISLVKGGKFGKMLRKRNINGIVLVISDVIGDDLNVIGSAPLYPYFTHIILANNMKMLKKAQLVARNNGFKAKIMTDCLEGEAREVSKVLMSMAKFVKNKKRKGDKYCFIFGGETTVTVRGKGKGGRNQELCLSSLQKMEKGITVISIGSDGRDFNEYAGAVVDYNDMIKAKRMGLEIRKYLENNDSTTILEKLSSLIKVGYTGTNVMDLIMVFVE